MTIRQPEKLREATELLSSFILSMGLNQPIHQRMFKVLRNTVNRKYSK